MNNRINAGLTLMTALPVCLLVMALTACAGTGKMRGPRSTVEIISCDSAVSVKAGDTIVIRLKSTPGTGYRWNLPAEGLSGLSEIGETRYEPANPDSERPMIGGPKIQVITLLAEKPGTHTVTLGYARPWLKDTPPDQTCSMTVAVTE